MEHIGEIDNFGEGWFSYPNLYSAVVKRFPSGSRFVEVGCWKGKSAVYMCVEIANSNKDIEFFCVDTWEGSVEHEGMKELPKLYDIFIDNMRPVGKYYFPLKMTSLEAAEKFKDNSLDFVFIDASHEYEDVRDDILAWYPKVKPSGIIAGHDYYHEEYDWFPGVKQAVNELLTGFTPDEKCWIYNKLENSKLNNSYLPENKNKDSQTKILFFGRHSMQEIAEYDFILNDILPEKTEKSSYFLSLDEIRTTDENFDVFVYSCRDPNNYPWGYMPTYADTLECVLKTQPKIIIQLSDEFYFENLQSHNNLANHCNLFLRQYNHLNYTYTENTLHIPLGYTNDCKVFSSSKKYDWSFIGEIKSDREEMINIFSKIPNHFISTNISRIEMCEIYSQSTFVICGRGNSSLNCFRQYEASMNGAIPVFVGSKEEIDHTFKYEQNPPWIFASTWESAFEICSDLLKNPEYLEEWKTILLSWWSDRLLYIQSKVNLIIEDSKNIIQNSLNNKLKNLPPVHYISVDYCTERREKLHQKFSEFGIENITGHIFQKYDDTQHEIISEYIDRLSIGSRGPVTSHLKAIKQWYDDTTEEVAFFCEDDLSMELVQYWNFTWDDFYNNLPDDWEIVQLAWLREGEFDRFKIGFRNRCWCDWSGCAYIIKREFAKKLIDNYYYDGRFHLDVKGSDIYLREDWAKVPVIETIIFSPLGRVYSAPLFTEDLSFMPSYLDPNAEEGKNQEVNSYHHQSYQCNLDWWRNIGSTLTIEEFMRE